MNLRLAFQRSFCKTLCRNANQIQSTWGRDKVSTSLSSNGEHCAVSEPGATAAKHVHLAPAMTSATAKSGKSERDGERGAEMLEFALIFAVLITLMLGIVAFSRAYNIYETITRGAREGARMAVLPSAWDGGSGGTYLDTCLASDACSCTSQPSNCNVYVQYILPALQASSLNPRACSGTSDSNCVANYAEQENWLDPSGSPDNQCGVIISFQYPYTLGIPFLPELNAAPLKIGTRVQMQLEPQPGGASPTCGGHSLP
jgi:TadE-like protein